MLQDSDANVRKVELLPSGAWQPAEEDERPRRAVKELHSVAPGDDDEVQIIGDTVNRTEANVSDKARLLQECFPSLPQGRPETSQSMANVSFGLRGSTWTCGADGAWGPCLAINASATEAV